MTPAIIVARLRDGRMTSAQHYTSRQVDVALAHIEAIRSAGHGVNVTICERSDGLGVNDTDRKRLERATRNRARK